MPDEDDSARGGRVGGEGRSEPGREFDPRQPECEDEAPAPGRPVTHGTPLAPDEYERLKERARRGDRERGAPAQRDRG
jgi:hypothetical protein